MRRRKAGQRLAQYNQELESMGNRPGRRDYQRSIQADSDATSPEPGSTQPDYSQMDDAARREAKRQAHQEFVRQYEQSLMKDSEEYVPPSTSIEINAGSSSGSGSSGNSLWDPIDTPGSNAVSSQGVDDSPEKQADFVSAYSGMNRFMQQDYADTSSIAQNAINRANQNSPIDLAGLDQRIRDREAYSRAKADQMGLNIFGDMYKYESPNYKQPHTEGPVETPDFDELYDKYKDDVNDAD